MDGDGKDHGRGSNAAAGGTRMIQLHKTSDLHSLTIEVATHIIHLRDPVSPRTIDRNLFIVIRALPFRVEGFRKRLQADMVYMLGRHPRIDGMVYSNNFGRLIQ